MLHDVKQVYPQCLNFADRYFFRTLKASLEACETLNGGDPQGRWAVFTMPGDQGYWVGMGIDKETRDFYLAKFKKDSNESFKLDSDANINGTSLKGYILVAPKLLLNIFGPHERGDDYKVSGEFIFTSKTGEEIFTVYDWKKTSLYDDIMESPASFWNHGEMKEFNIGGKTDCTEFKLWLQAKINNHKGFAV